jgi:hypothetical protein
MVLVVELNIGAVLFSDGDVRHGEVPLSALRLGLR